MNELWIIGVVGGGAGAAVGGPLVLRGRTRGEPWTTEQLVGLWLLGTSFALLLVGVRHGELLTPGWDLAVELITDGLSFAAWTTLVSLTRRIVGRTPLLPIGAHLLLPLVYGLVMAAVGFPDVPFLWLMPVGVVSLCAIGWTWYRARATAGAGATRKAGVILAFATVFCAAQGIRSLFPQVVEVREIVPIVVTISIFAMAFALVRTRGGIDDGIVVEAPRYRKSSLTIREADRLIEELEARMESSGWYRETGLSLATIAARLGIPPQTLSQALNQRRGQSLTEYLVGKRIREAKRLILDPANDCFTVEGLARRSGFASRSAFYKAFRKAEGVTPVQYRDRARPVSLGRTLA